MLNCRLRGAIPISKKRHLYKKPQKTERYGKFYTPCFPLNSQNKFVNTSLVPCLTKRMHLAAAPCVNACKWKPAPQLQESDQDLDTLTK